MRLISQRRQVIKIRAILHIIIETILLCEQQNNALSGNCIPCTSNFVIKIKINYIILSLVNFSVFLVTVFSFTE